MSPSKAPQILLGSDSLLDDQVDHNLTTKTQTYTLNGFDYSTKSLEEDSMNEFRKRRLLSNLNSCMPGTVVETKDKGVHYKANTTDPGMHSVNTNGIKNELKVVTSDHKL
jgi:phosphoserine aminotransferase